MPRHKTYKVTLTDEQRAHLINLLRKGEAKARRLTRARILLLSAEGKTNLAIADVLKVTAQTVRNRGCSKNLLSGHFRLSNLL